MKVYNRFAAAARSETGYRPVCNWQPHTIYRISRRAPWRQERTRRPWSQEEDTCGHLFRIYPVASQNPRWSLAAVIPFLAMLEAGGIKPENLSFVDGEWLDKASWIWTYVAGEYSCNGLKYLPQIPRIPHYYVTVKQFYVSVLFNSPLLRWGSFSAAGYNCSISRCFTSVWNHRLP